MASKAESPSDIPLSFIPCRAFRHEPRFQNDHITRGASQEVIEFTRETVCNVCGTTILTTYSVPDFRVKRRKYLYPDNYQVKGGLPVFDARMTYIEKRFQ